MYDYISREVQNMLFARRVNDRSVRHFGERIAIA